MMNLISVPHSFNVDAKVQKNFHFTKFPAKLCSISFIIFFVGHEVRHEVGREVGREVLWEVKREVNACLSRWYAMA